MLPGSKRLASPVLEAEIAARGGSRLALDELVMRLAETVLRILAGTSEIGRAVSLRDERRVSNVLRYIEENAEQQLDLAGLADVAGISKYHFLRAFRRTVGVTPYQFLLALRMCRAAIKLRTTPLSVTTIAFDTGFSDLSTFSRQFRDCFRVSPGRFRHGRGS
jgi:transcriptional regulator GlxA family with amidase domain